jgi:hypothetical protein
MLLSALLVAASLQQGPDSIVRLAKETLRPLTDSAVLHKAGYFAIGFGGSSKDLSPFQGQHWLAVRQFLQNPPTDVTKPTIVMYLPIGDSLIPIGVAHTKRAILNTPSPTDIGGTPAEWHTHVVCRGIPGEGQVIVDGVENCLNRGGQPGANQITMVHAWTVPNPDGPFAHDNPALPFIANGLRPPTRFTTDDRRFAIAIGEAYGARLMQGTLIESHAATALRTTKLPEYRATMRGIVQELVVAEKKGDDKAFAAARKRALALYETILAEYRAAALTPQIRKQFELELEQMLGAGHHHGG